jgi:putative flippase GtrA
MIRREFKLFLVVGLLTVLIDFCIYRTLVWTNLFGIDIAKAMGFVAGTLFAYFANRFWTFGHKQHSKGSMWRFAILYALTLFINLMINSVVLVWLASFYAAVQIAFLMATSISAALNFVGMKLFVFREYKMSKYIDER